MDYHFERYQASDLIRLDILINNESVDALALIIHRDNSVYKGARLLKR